jgi:Tol biopolymer transport system component
VALCAVATLVTAGLVTAPTASAATRLFSAREAASISADGTRSGNGPSSIITTTEYISGDGRYVVFGTQARNLVASDTDGFIDIVVRDTVNDTAERISVPAGGGPADGHSVTQASITPDGRYVVFYSNATNLVASDTNGSATDFFLLDRQTGTTEIYSLDNNGAQTSGSVTLPVVSGNGQYALWTTSAAIDPADVNGFQDAYMRDRQTGTTTLISAAPGGGR